MSTPLNLADILANTLTRKSVEPAPRLCGGRFGYVRHRFPIKGGISLNEVMLRNINKTNPLLERLRDNHK